MTFIEILVTIVILGIVIAPVTRLIVFSAFGTGKTKDHVIAFNLARDKMERLKMLKFEELVDEGNDILTRAQLDLDQNSEEFLKEYKRRYLTDYPYYPEDQARFERIVKVDEKADTVHPVSIMKKVTVIVRSREKQEEVCRLITLVAHY